MRAALFHGGLKFNRKRREDSPLFLRFTPRRAFLLSSFSSQNLLWVRIRSWFFNSFLTPLFYVQDHNRCAVTERCKCSPLLGNFPQAQLPGSRALLHREGLGLSRRRV